MFLFNFILLTSYFLPSAYIFLSDFNNQVSFIGLSSYKIFYFYLVNLQIYTLNLLTRFLNGLGRILLHRLFQSGEDNQIL